MYNFRKINILTGWTLWLISLIVYISYCSQNISYENAGELAACAYKLEVGTQPGSPFFIILSRFFSIFSGNSISFATQIVSSIAASTSILFLFWSYTLISSRVLSKINIPNTNLLIISSGAIAALSFAFTDSFWHSAISGSYYTLSTCVTLVIVWTMLRWKKHENYKWLLLISLLLGISLSINSLTLFIIPALALLFYYKKYTPSILGSILVFLGSIILIVIILNLLIPSFLGLGSLFDLFFVNILSLPFNFGFVFYLLLFWGICILAILYFKETHFKKVSSIILLIALFILGFSINFIILIRAQANPPINYQNANNPFTFDTYINESKEANIPLLYGQTYNAPVTDIITNETQYTKTETDYQETKSSPKPIYDSNFKMFFPRMWSSNIEHEEAYKYWGGIEDGKNTIAISTHGKTIEKPTFAQNLRYFISYQLNHMYIRYFMWNFAGRQNDALSNGEPHKGNWISGISFIDYLRLGPQDSLPKLYKINKAHNTYYMLPFLLSILGIVFLWKRHKKYFAITLSLFLCTSLLYIVYFNQYPLQARERDYLYITSFSIFSLFIGFGIIWTYIYIYTKFKKQKLTIALVLTGLCPIILFAENFDDHNLQGRTMTYDFSKNILESCDPNAILFANSDYDTYPLLYLQEVDGFRTDIRIIDINLLNIDWYIDKLKHRINYSAPIKLSLPRKKYETGTNEQLFVLANSKISHMYYPVKDIIQIISSDDPNLKALQNNETLVDYIPVPNVILPVNIQNALQSGIISSKDTLHASTAIPFTLVGRNEYNIITDSLISKNKLIMLDILANYNWQFPIYFSSNLESTNYLNLYNNLYLEGLAYKLKPIEVQSTNTIEKQIDTEKMYENILRNFSWGNCNNPSVYIDENMRNMAISYRNILCNLADVLLQEGKNSKALQIMQLCESKFPDNLYPYDYFMIPIAKLYERMNYKQKSSEISLKIYTNCSENLLYYLTVSSSKKKIIEQDVFQEIGTLIDVYQHALASKDTRLTKQIETFTTAFFEQYFSFIRQVSLCLPEEFETKNSWAFQLEGNLPYIAYWYNAMKIKTESVTE